jgi:hypothetical protein
MFYISVLVAYISKPGLQDYVYLAISEGGS